MLYGFRDGVDPTLQVGENRLHKASILWHTHVHIHANTLYIHLYTYPHMGTHIYTQAHTHIYIHSPILSPYKL